MKVHALTVCVNKADHLDKCIDRWRCSLESLTIVTSPEDNTTRPMLKSHAPQGDVLACASGRPVELIVTDAFTRDGATFNKGRAMEEARLAMPWEDWILFLDCDVVPPLDWLARVEAALPRPGLLYGCHRFQAPDEGPYDDLGQPNLAGDVPCVGFFQLFHSDDEALGAWAASKVGKWTATGPLLDTHWLHAGNYDNRFMDRWRPPLRPRNMRKNLDGFRLAHLGERDGWWGRGERAKFDEMQAERRRRGGRWDHETIDPRWLGREEVWR